MIKIGILGAAGIAQRSIIEPARRRTDVVIDAVASARPEAAKAYAIKHGIVRSLESYEALICDPAIDVIYNALPPSAHAAWSIAALQAGKHVLCEKPIAVSATEAREMVQVAKSENRILMEAFHDRYHPLTRHVLDLRDSGALGQILAARATFFVNVPFDPHSIRHVPALGGGAMMDLGCYPVHWLRTLFASEPEVVSAHGEANPLGVDERMVAEFTFGAATASLHIDLVHGPMHAALHVETANGSLEVNNPVLPQLGHSIITRLDGAYRHYTVAGGTSFDYQLDSLMNAISGAEAPLTGGEDAIRNMETIDRIMALSGFPRAGASLETPGS